VATGRVPSLPASARITSSRSPSRTRNRA